MLKYIVVDAFSRHPFAGVPVAVVLRGDLDPDTMQKVAREINLPVTAFLQVQNVQEVVPVSFWTPDGPLAHSEAGYLACAHVIWHEGYTGHGVSLRFSDAQGDVIVRKRADHLCLESKSIPLQEVATVPPFIDSLPQKCYVGQVGEDYLVELESEEALMALPAVFPMPSAWNPSAGLVVTAAAKGIQDFCFRSYRAEPGALKESLAHMGAGLLLSHWQKLSPAGLCGESAGARRAIVFGEKAGDSFVVSGQSAASMKGFLLAL